MSVCVAAAPAPSAPAHAQDPIRVMVVDDAVVVRGLVSRWIDAEPDLKIVASLRTGREAVEQVDAHDPDVVMLDVDMPDIDGITALPLLLEKKRDLVVIMASTLTRRNAEVSLRALSLGAADYIPKPQTNREVTTSATFRRELIDKIRQLGARRKRPRADARRAFRSRRPARRAAHRARRDSGSRVRRAAPHPAEHGRHQAAAVPADAAARAADRLLDRRSAGADAAGRRHRTGDRPRAGADHPAHAADLHDHSGRAPRARERTAGRARRSTASRSSPARSISRPAAAT